MLQNRFARPFFQTGIIATLPILLFITFSRKLKSYDFNTWEIVQIAATYFALFGIISLIMAAGYWLKTRNNKVISEKRTRLNLILTLSAFGIFAVGTLIAKQIGGQKFGGFVALALLLNIASLVVFIINISKIAEG